VKTKAQQKRERVRIEMIRGELDFFRKRNKRLSVGDCEQREQWKRGLEVERRLAGKLRELT